LSQSTPIQGPTPQGTAAATIVQPPSASKGRIALAVVIFIVAGLLAPVAFIGAWASRTIDDTDRYVSTVAPLIDSPEVRAAVTMQVTDALFASVPVEQLLGEALPPRAAVLSGPIASGLESFVRSRVAEILSTPEARAAWVTINIEFQSRLIAALKGESSGAIRVEGDSIVLDTGVLFEKVRELLVRQGFTIFEKVPLPAAVDREFVLLKSDQIKTVSTIYRVVEPLANALVFVVLGLLLLGTYVSTSRRYGVFAAGWILIVTGAFLIGLLAVARAAFLAELNVPDASWQAVTFDTVSRFLDGLGRTAVTLGVVGVIGAFLAGPARVALAIRHEVMALAQRLGTALVSAVPSLARTGRVFASARAVFGGIILVVGAWFLIWGRTASTGRIFWIVVLGLIAWFAVLVVAESGGTAPDQVDETIADAPVATSAGADG